jgi:hypothetical protein
MIPHYGTYATESSDGTYIYTSVLTDGYMSGTPGIGCNLNGALHTPGAYNQIGTTGGWQNGTPGCMTCGVNVQNNQQIVGVPGIIDFTGEGQVICNKYGGFWYYITHLQFELI